MTKDDVKDAPWWVQYVFAIGMSVIGAYAAYAAFSAKVETRLQQIEQRQDRLEQQGRADHDLLMSAPTKQDLREMSQNISDILRTMNDRLDKLADQQRQDRRR